MNDELEAVGAGDCIPTDPRITVLESLGGTVPTQDGAELADFKRIADRANLKGGIDVNSRSEGRRGGHDDPNMQIRGSVFREKLTI